MGAQQIRRAAVALLWVLPLLASTVPSAAGAQATLTIQYDRPLHAVSPTLYGLMTEEINHAYDGGLYAELIRDRVFYRREHHEFIKIWSLDQNAKDGMSWGIDDATGPSTALPYSLRLTAAKASARDPGGIDNPGFWGVPVWPHTTYHASIYLKADGRNPGPVTLAIVNDHSGKVLARATFPAAGAHWKRYTATLRTGAVAESEHNFVRITISHPGSVLMNLPSLFPPTYDGQPNGDRIDLMDKLAALRPKFLRFPGGNFLEGNTLADWYDWKLTIGPLVDRPTHPSPWGYQSSDGLGLLEFLQWCQDLHMQPVLAVYAGYSLRGEHVAPGPDLAPYVQSALDEIQYVTGGADTKWGAVRAEDGHPAPFPLTYVEVGNEDEFDRSGSYDARFAQFFDAIRKAYPKLQVIATAPVKGRTPDVIDDHFYRTAQEFFEDTHHYDKTDRSGPKIFVGEWATMEGTPTPDMGAALADAAWLTGLERNSDIVIMASYAPLFINVNPGASQWVPDLIGYDAVHSYGSPGYYAQAMFSNHLGNEVVDSSLKGDAPLLFYSATRDESKRTLYLKVVNASSKPLPLEIQLIGKDKPQGTAAVTTLSGHSMEETNSLAEPARILPVKSAITDVSSDWKRIFPAYSIEIIEVHMR